MSATLSEVERQLAMLGSDTPIRSLSTHDAAIITREKLAELQEKAAKWDAYERQNTIKCGDLTIKPDPRLRKDEMYTLREVDEHTKAFVAMAKDSGVCPVCLGKHDDQNRCKAKLAEHVKQWQAETEREGYNLKFVVKPPPADELKLPSANIAFRIEPTPADDVVEHTFTPVVKYKAPEPTERIGIAAKAEMAQELLAAGVITTPGKYLDALATPVEEWPRTVFVDGVTYGEGPIAKERAEMPGPCSPVRSAGEQDPLGQGVATDGARMNALRAIAGLAMGLAGCVLWTFAEKRSRRGDE